MSETSRRRAWVALVAAVALLVVAAAAAIVVRVGLTVQAGAYVVVVALLGVASLSDVRSRTVPNAVVATLAVLWVATVWFVPCGTAPGEVGSAFAGVSEGGVVAVALDGLAGGLAIGVGMLLLALVVETRTGRHSFGGGDIKLLFAVGLFLGLPASLTMLLIACIFAVGLSFVAWAAFPRGLMGGDSDEPFMRATIPFAPAIAAATTLSLAFGPFSLFV